jgi:hypothetical protein
VLRSTVSRPVCLGVRPHLGPETRFLLLSNSCGFVDVGAPLLTRGRVCRLQLLPVSPAQAFSGSSPAGLMTIFNCLRLETPETCRIKSPYLSSRNRVAQLFPQALGSLTLSPPTTHMATVDVFETASTRVTD